MLLGEVNHRKVHEIEPLVGFKPREGTKLGNQCPLYINIHVAISKIMSLLLLIYLFNYQYNLFDNIPLIVIK